MSSQTYEAGSPPGDGQPPRPFRSSLLSRVRSRYPPETLIIPVIFALKLGMELPSTTLLELERQTVCRLSNTLHGHPVPVLAVGATSQECDTPEVMRDFATIIAVFGVIGGVTALLGCGVLSRISPHYGRKPIFQFIVLMQIMWSCLVLGSQFMPDGLADWVLLLGFLFNTFAGHLPEGYLVTLYIVDICLPEHRTAMMSKIGGWGVLGVSIPLAVGGSITTKTGNPLIVFYIATIIFVATYIYIASVLPETLTEEKRNLSCSDLDSSIPSSKPSRLASLLSIFDPLKMVLPSRTRARNWPLTWCVAHIFVYMTFHGYVWSAWFVVVTSKYHFTPADIGLYWASVTFVGMITLTVIVPQLVRLLRPYFSRGIVDYELADVDLDSGGEPQLEISNHLDVYMAMTGCVLLGICTIFAAMSSTMLALIICSIFVGLTFVHGPTVRSLVVGCVDPHKQDEALAAFEMVDGVGKVLSPIIMGAIFRATVDSMPLFLFFMQLFCLIVSAVLLLFVRDANGYQKLSST